MRIKTITCHEVYNHGASLQEYALLKFLNQEGYHAEALHYKPSYLSHHFKLSAVSFRFDKPLLKQIYLLIKLPGRLIDLKRKRAFDDFAIKYIPTNSKLYNNNEELIKDLPLAEAFICGSDQIWNSYFENGKDPAFYLDFVPKDKLKISYAASFAIDELESSIKPFVKKLVSNLDAVGVRETSGVRILNELGIDNAVQVLDPVFLLSAQHWIDTFVTNEFDKPYLFIYDFDSNPLIEEIALNLKKEKGFLIYTVNKNISYADKNFYLEGPETFLSLIHHSQFNITNSFHAVAFSLIFEKQFIVVNRTEAINTRMRDLLGLFNISNLLINSVEQFDTVTEIDYSILNERKDSYAANSKKFLSNALIPKLKQY